MEGKDVTSMGARLTRDFLGARHGGDEAVAAQPEEFSALGDAAG